MRELHADLAAGPLPYERNDARHGVFVLVGIETKVRIGDASLGAHVCRFEEGQTWSGQCVVTEIYNVPIVRVAISRRVLAHRRDHDPVLERQAAQRDGRE